MKHIVIGSGPCAVSAALKLLKKNKNVEIWDSGHSEKINELSFLKENFLEIKKDFNKIFNYYYGDNLQGIMEPNSKELFNIPSSRDFILDKKDLSDFELKNNFNLTLSLNKGGLSNGWGANFVHYDDNDIKNWPLSINNLEKYYEDTYNRIPITHAEDSLNNFLKFKGNQKSINLSNLDKIILNKYRSKQSSFKKNNFYLGFSRMAVKTSYIENSCTYCNRCIWGCPNHSIYNASSDIDKCLEYKNFKYFGKRYILKLITNEDKIIGIEYQNTITKKIFIEKIECIVILAAGAIGSGKIFLRTVANSKYSNNFNNKLPILDTTVIKNYYFNPLLIGKKINYKMFQFNRLIACILQKNSDWPKYLHIEILNLGSLYYYPLIEKIPLPSFLSKDFFYSFKESLGVASMFMPDQQNNRNNLKYNVSNNKFEIFYNEGSNKNKLMELNNRDLKNKLLKLGCIVFKTNIEKPGSGIHYAGTIPMGYNGHINNNGKSNFFKNLFVADSSAFLDLPSKPITLNAATYASFVADKI